MLERLKRIIQIEWQVQQLHKRFDTEGPLIEPVITMGPHNIDLPKESINYLVMQGSFDPPTTAHLTLLNQAIKLLSQKVSLNSLQVFIALSLAHVEKKTKILHNSLFGDRIAMLETLVHNISVPIPITIGFSNVARYLDLIRGFQTSYGTFNSLNFLMGMDVFKKILDPHFYSQPLEDLLPLIFQADYLVAGRNDLFIEDEFKRYLNEHLLIQCYQKAIKFITVPDKLRNITATQIRDKFSNNDLVEGEWLLSAVSTYVKNHNIYNKSPKWQSVKIIIQQVIHLALQSNKSKKTALRVLNVLIPEIERDINLQKQLIEEYQQGKSTQINQKWNQLIKSIS